MNLVAPVGSLNWTFFKAIIIFVCMNRILVKLAFARTMDTMNSKWCPSDWVILPLPFKLPWIPSSPTSPSIYHCLLRWYLDLQSYTGRTRDSFGEGTPDSSGRAICFEDVKMFIFSKSSWISGSCSVIKGSRIDWVQNTGYLTVANSTVHPSATQLLRPRWILSMLHPWIRFNCHTIASLDDQGLICLVQHCSTSFWYVKRSSDHNPCFIVTKFLPSIYIRYGRLSSGHGRGSIAEWPPHCFLQQAN